MLHLEAKANGIEFPSYDSYDDEVVDAYGVTVIAPNGVIPGPTDVGSEYDVSTDVSVGPKYDGGGDDDDDDDDHDTDMEEIQVELKNEEFEPSHLKMFFIELVIYVYIHDLEKDDEGRPYEPLIRDDDDEDNGDGGKYGRTLASLVHDLMHYARVYYKLARLWMRLAREGSKDEGLEGYAESIAKYQLGLTTMEKSMRSMVSEIASSRLDSSRIVDRFDEVLRNIETLCKGQIPKFSYESECESPPVHFRYRPIYHAVNADGNDGNSSDEDDADDKGKGKDKDKPRKTKRKREEDEEEDTGNGGGGFKEGRLDPTTTTTPRVKGRETRDTDTKSLEQDVDMGEFDVFLSSLPADVWSNVFSEFDWDSMGRLFSILRRTSKKAIEQLKYIVFDSVLRDRPTMVGRVPSVTKYIANNSPELVTHLQYSPFCRILLPPSTFSETLEKLEILDMDVHRDKYARQVFQDGGFQKDGRLFRLKVREVEKGGSEDIPYMDYYARWSASDYAKQTASDKENAVPSAVRLDLGDDDYKQLFEKECEQAGRRGPTIYPKLKELHVKSSHFVTKRWFSSCIFPALETLVIDETLVGYLDFFVNRKIKGKDGITITIPAEIEPHPVMFEGQFDDECLSALSLPFPGSLKNLTFKGIKLAHGVTEKTWERLGVSLTTLSLGPCYSYNNFVGPSRMSVRDQWLNASFLENHSLKHLTNLTALEVVSDMCLGGTTNPNMFSNRMMLSYDTYHAYDGSPGRDMSGDPGPALPWGGRIVPIPESILPVQMYDPVLPYLDSTGITAPFGVPSVDSHADLKNPWERRRDYTTTTLEEGWTELAKAGNLKKLKFLGYFELGLEGNRTPYSGFVRYLTCLEDLHLDFALFTNPFLERLGYEYGTPHANLIDFCTFLRSKSNGVRNAVFSDVTENLVNLTRLKMTHFSLGRLDTEKIPLPLEDFNLNTMDKGGAGGAGGGDDEDYDARMKIIHNLPVKWDKLDRPLDKLPLLKKLSLKSNYADGMTNKSEYDKISSVPTRKTFENGLEGNCVTDYLFRLEEKMDKDELHRLGLYSVRPAYTRDGLAKLWADAMWYYQSLSVDVSFFNDLVLRGNLESITFRGCDFEGDYKTNRPLSPSKISLYTSSESATTASTTTTTTTTTTTITTTTPTTPVSVQTRQKRWALGVELRKLKLVDCASTDVDYIVRDVLNFPKLESLSLLRVSGLTDEAFVYHKEYQSSPLKAGDYLENPHKYGESPLYGIDRLALTFGKRVHLQVLLRFPNVKKLFLCPDVLPYYLDIRTSVVPSHIRGVDKTPRYPDYWTGLDGIVANMGHLEELNLLKCFDFDGSGLVDLHRLKRLGLYWCPAVNNDNLKRLFYLQSLSLEYSSLTNFTPDFVVLHRPQYADRPKIDPTTLAPVPPAPLESMRYLKRLSVNANANLYDDPFPWSFRGTGGQWQLNYTKVLQYRTQIVRSVRSLSSRLYELGYDGFQAGPQALSIGQVGTHFT